MFEMDDGEGDDDVTVGAGVETRVRGQMGFIVVCGTAVSV